MFKDLYYRYLFKKIQVLKYWDDIFYRLFGDSYTSKFKSVAFVSSMLNNTMDYLGYKVVETSYEELGNVKAVNSYEAGSMFLCDAIFNAVYNSEDYNSMMDTLAYLHFEIGMIKLERQLEQDREALEDLQTIVAVSQGAYSEL